MWVAVVMSGGHGADKRWDFRVVEEGFGDVASSDRIFRGKLFPTGHYEFLKYGFRGRTCDRRSAAGKAHAFENLPRVDRRMDCRKNPEAAVTIGTFQYVNFENPGQ